MRSATQKPRLLTPNEAAQLLRMPTARLVRLARQGAVPHVMLPGEEPRFVETELWSWLERRSASFQEAHHGK